MPLAARGLGCDSFLRKDVALTDALKLDGSEEICGQKIELPEGRRGAHLELIKAHLVRHMKAFDGTAKSNVV